MTETRTRPSARRSWRRLSAPLSLLAAAGMMLTFATDTAAADPRTTTVTATLIQDVPDGSVWYDGLTRPTYSMGGLEIVGHDAYLTKNDPAAAGNGWATFYHVRNFNKPNATMVSSTVTLKGSSVPVDMGHVNGMAYYRTPGTNPIDVGSFYIPMIKAVGSYQVAQVNARGEITAQFKARQGTTEKKIASISYHGNGRFIVGTASENTIDPTDGTTILKPYYLATIKHDYFELTKKFYVPTTPTFNVGQDIHYDAKKDELLVPVWDGENTEGTATGRRDRIIVIRMGRVRDGHVYSPTRWIDLTAPAAEVSKFEVEGLCVDDGGKLFVASNILDTDGTTGMDGIHRLRPVS